MSDFPWGKRKLEILAYGYSVEANENPSKDDDHLGVVFDGATAYEQRCSAYDSGNVEAICEPAQLDLAACKGILRNKTARYAVLLLARTGANTEDLGLFLKGDPARGRKLVDQGLEIIRRYEKHRSSRGVSGGVRQEGRGYGRDMAADQASGAGGSESVESGDEVRRGPGRPAGSFRPKKPVEEMTLKELIDTQDKGDEPPDQSTWRTKRVPLYDSIVREESVRRYEDSDN